MGAFNTPSDIVFTSTAVVTLYLKVNVTTVINNVDVLIDLTGERGGIGANGQRGLYTDTNSSHAESQENEMILEADEVMKVEVAVPIHKIDTRTQAEVNANGLIFGRLLAGGEIRLSVQVSAVSKAKTPTEVVVLYGSTNHPTRVSAPVAALPTGVKETSQLVSYFLADDHAYSKVVAAGPTAQKRLLESVGTVNGVPLTGTASAALPPSAWSWGKQALASRLKPNADAVVSLWIGPGEGYNPGGLTGLRVVAVFYPTAGPHVIRQQDIGLLPKTFTTGSAAMPIHLALNMTGINLPAGSSFELFFYTSSTSDSAGTKLYVSYGVAGAPSAIQFMVAPGEAGDPPPTPTPSSGATPGPKTPSSPVAESASPVSLALPMPATAGADGTLKGAGALAKVKDINPPADVPGGGLLVLVIAVGASVLLLRRPE